MPLCSSYKLIDFRYFYDALQDRTIGEKLRGSLSPKIYVRALRKLASSGANFLSMFKAVRSIDAHLNHKEGRKFRSALYKAVNTTWEKKEREVFLHAFLLYSMGEYSRGISFAGNALQLTGEEKSFLLSKVLEIDVGVPLRYNQVTWEILLSNDEPVVEASDIVLTHIYNLCWSRFRDPKFKDEVGSFLNKNLFPLHCVTDSLAHALFRKEIHHCEFSPEPYKEVGVTQNRPKNVDHSDWLMGVLSTIEDHDVENTGMYDTPDSFGMSVVDYLLVLAVDNGMTEADNILEENLYKTPEQIRDFKNRVISFACKSRLSTFPYLHMDRMLNGTPYDLTQEDTEVFLHGYDRALKSAFSDVHCEHALDDMLKIIQVYFALPQSIREKHDLVDQILTMRSGSHMLSDHKAKERNTVLLRYIRDMDPANFTLKGIGKNNVMLSYLPFLDAFEAELNEALKQPVSEYRKAILGT